MTTGIKMKNAKVNDIYRDPNGNLWIVTGKSMKDDFGGFLDDPVLFMEHVRLPHQQKILPKISKEISSEVWKGFKRLDEVKDVPKSKKITVEKTKFPTDTSTDQ